jgi:hypothetical protein
MGKSCYTGKEFDELVKKLGNADAIVATKQFQLNPENENKIPSVKEANRILFGAKEVGEEQRLAIKSDTYKKKKATEQLVLLNKLALRSDNVVTSSQKKQFIN